MTTVMMAVVNSRRGLIVAYIRVIVNGLYYDVWKHCEQIASSFGCVVSVCIVTTSHSISWREYASYLSLFVNTHQTEGLLRIVALEYFFHRRVLFASLLFVSVMSHCAAPVHIKATVSQTWSRTRESVHSV